MSVIQNLLRLLSPREQEPLLLRLEAMKYREIADRLGISVNSVNSLLARALQKLQKAVTAKQPIKERRERHKKKPVTRILRTPFCWLTWTPNFQGQRSAQRRSICHSCWKCRAALAELELQAQAVSKMLCHEDESDIARAEKAKAKFLERKSFFEARTRRSVRRFTCHLLHSHRNHATVLRWFEQATLETA